MNKSDVSPNSYTLLVLPRRTSLRHHLFVLLEKVAIGFGDAGRTFFFFVIGAN